MHISSKQIKQHTAIDISHVYLPNNWWNTSYSFNFLNQNEPTILKIENRNSVVSNKNEDYFVKSLKKSIAKGDYIIKENNSYKKDYVANQKMKKKIAKYLIFPMVIISLIFTFSILNIIADFPL